MSAMTGQVLGWQQSECLPLRPVVLWNGRLCKYITGLGWGECRQGGRRQWAASVRARGKGWRVGGRTEVYLV